MIVKRGAQRARLQSATVPAPIGGLNTVSSGAAMDPSDCLVLWNMISAEYGLRTRLGWREWCTGLDGDVRSILPFTAGKGDGSNNKLFAATASGIYDVTASSGAPVSGPDPRLVVTFPVATQNAGWGSSTTFAVAGGHALIYCDEVYGYYLYEERNSTWTKITAGTGDYQISGVNNGVNIDPALFAQVIAWKGRLWFVERDSSRAWYLPPGQLWGEAKAFTFGTKFKAGGDLRCLVSESFDGGSGLDDALICISGGGDVLAYKGSDPSQASAFGQVGAWFVGAVPAGRRIATEVGGDVLLMTALGLLPLSKLTSGESASSSMYQTAKVGTLFNQLQQATANVRGWAARIHPADSSLVVIVPTAPGAPTQQLVMNLVTKSWSQYRGLPMGGCAEAFGGTLYFGTTDGRVCINDGYLDGVLRDGTGGTPIDFSLITAFSNLGRPTQKRIQLLRPTFVSLGSLPQYRVEARFRWDLTEAVAPPVAAGAGSGVAVWDGLGASSQFASSDTDMTHAKWAGAYTAQQLVFGAQGMGPEVALAVRGSATARMTFVSVDVAYDEGGIL